MMFLTNIGLNNNTASTHNELIQAIENAGFEVLEYIYAVGEYDGNYEPTFVALLTMENGTQASVCAAMDSLSDELSQECIPVCFASLEGFMCGQNPKGYEFDNNYLLTLQERNRNYQEPLSEINGIKVYADYMSYVSTKEFWTEFLSA